MPWHTFKHDDGVLPLKANLEFKKQRKLQPRNIDGCEWSFFDLDQTTSHSGKVITLADNSLNHKQLQTP